jgi:hypothetical protein
MDWLLALIRFRDADRKAQVRLFHRSGSKISTYFATLTADTNRPAFTKAMKATVR